MKKNEIDIDINSGDNNKKEEAHKFDSFFIICLITILGIFFKIFYKFFFKPIFIKKNI